MPVGKEWSGSVGHAPPKPAPKPIMYVKETDYSATVPDYSEDMEINKGSGLLSEWESKQLAEDTIFKLWAIIDDIREIAEDLDDEALKEHLLALALVYESKFSNAYNKLTKE